MKIPDKTEDIDIPGELVEAYEVLLKLNVWVSLEAVQEKMKKEIGMDPKEAEMSTDLIVDQYKAAWRKTINKEMKWYKAKTRPDAEYLDANLPPTSIYR